MKRRMLTPPPLPIDTSILGPRKEEPAVRAAMGGYKSSYTCADRARDLADKARFRKDLDSLFTSRRDDHGQRCHQCDEPLIATADHSETGHHFWVLVCGHCMVRYTYRTQASELRTYPLEGVGWLVAKHGKRTNDPNYDNHGGS